MCGQWTRMETSKYNATIPHDNKAHIYSCIRWNMSKNSSLLPSIYICVCVIIYAFSPTTLINLFGVKCWYVLHILLYTEAVAPCCSCSYVTYEWPDEIHRIITVYVLAYKISSVLFSIQTKYLSSLSSLSVCLSGYTSAPD